MLLEIIWPILSCAAAFVGGVLSVSTLRRKVAAIGKLDNALSEAELNELRAALEQTRSGHAESLAHVQALMEEVAKKSLPVADRSLALEGLRQSSAQGRVRWLEQRAGSRTAAA